MKTKIILVPHCHWDREWFHPEPTFQVLLEKQMSDLKTYNGSYYNFDGHTWALDDYLKINKLDKKMAEKMKKGIINFGPLYVQSDWYSSMFPTLQINLEIGKDLTQKYSKLTDLVYIADSFGFNEQMPQIFKKNGFNKFVAWRGIKKEDVSKANLLIWKGIDNSQLLSSFMADSYSTFVGIGKEKSGFESYPYHVRDFNNNKEIVLKFKTKVIDIAVKSCKERRKQNCYWIPFGHDWAAIPKNINSFIQVLNELDEENEFVLGSYQNYFDAVKDLEAPILEYSNLFYSGTSKIHRSIASNRYDIKKLFRDNEINLFYQMEQLEIIFAKLGGKLYSKAFKENYIYKPLLAASAHDSLGGCNDDLTNSLAQNRLLNIKKTIEAYCDFMIRQIRDNQQLKINDYIIFNPAPFEQDLLFLDQISSDKDKGLFYKDNETNIFTFQTKDESHSMSGKCFNHQVAISALKMPAMSFRIVTLNSKQPEMHFNLETSEFKMPFNLVIDENFGDEFDFSTDEKALVKKYSKFNLSNFYQFENFNIIEGYYQDEFKKMKFKINFTIIDNGVKKHLFAKTHNKLKNARISLEFKTKNAVLSRNLAFIKQKVDHIPNWKELGYRDKPINHFTNDGLVQLDSGLNILTKGTNEVEIKDDSIYLVLARFSSHIGKENLNYRPGVASGPPKLLPTPEAQLNKDLNFELGFSYQKPIEALNEWMFQGFGSQEGQKDFLNQISDYFRFNFESFEPQEIEIPLINHKEYLIGLYNLKEDKVKYILANPTEKENNLKPYEIDYKNYY